MLIKVLLAASIAVNLALFLSRNKFKLNGHTYVVTTSSNYISIQLKECDRLGAFLLATEGDGLVLRGVGDESVDSVFRMEALGENRNVAQVTEVLTANIPDLVKRANQLDYVTQVGQRRKAQKNNSAVE